MPYEAPEAEGFKPPASTESSPAQTEAFSTMKDFNSVLSDMTKSTASLSDLELFDSASVASDAGMAAATTAESTDAGNKQTPRDEHLQSSSGRNKPNPDRNDEPWVNPKERIGKGRPIGQN